MNPFTILTRRRRMGGYVVAVVLTAVTLGLQWRLESRFHDSGPFSLFIPAVIVSAWYGGVGPGLLATLLGALARQYHFVEPHRGLGPPEELDRLATFLVAGVMNSALFELLHRSRRRSEEDAEQLRANGQVLQRQAEELAAADFRKDEFLTMLGHELRNPLAAISNAAYVLIQSFPRNAQEAWCRGTISRQTELLGVLIDDLLDLSQIALGRVELHKSTVYVDEVIRRSVETAQPRIDARQHHLSVLVPTTPIRLEGEAIRLEQVVVNLLINAAKYTAPGGHIALAVTLEPETCEHTGTAGPWVTIRVRDDGIGIHPEAMAHLFDLYSQSERGRELRDGGLGIGLAMARRLVELHGGTVSAQSEGPGCGSEFVVRLLVAPGSPQVLQANGRRFSLTN